ncbi:MAG: 2-dehydro-3-deoxygalactonokinase [Gammaproteobacteria bacterium]|nr:2-dehydro-3-deoxygalactonokinase [Gammaproteobacteria bacterium]
MIEIKAKWIAADWGTTHIRAWAIGEEDNVLAFRESNEGMKDLQQNQFEPVLLKLIESWLNDTKVTTVIACGMGGSKQGWVETPYLKTPCVPIDNQQLAIATTKDNRIKVNFVPGVMQNNLTDIMRGEETQIAGFINKNPDFNGVVCLPGTHTKWVNVKEGQITSFKTFMTGELFGVISNHTLIRHSISIKGWNQAGFEAGIHEGFNNPGSIASDLFSLRAESIVNDLDRDQARSTLSGLLLGVELNGAQTFWENSNVIIIGSQLLSNNYLQGLKILGGQSQLFSLETATLSGLSFAYRELNSN